MNMYSITWTVCSAFRGCFYFALWGCGVFYYVSTQVDLKLLGSRIHVAIGPWVAGTMSPIHLAEG